MAKKRRQYHPGDAANEFIRVLLSDAGELAGGLSDEEWDKTLQYFGGRCAYSGERVTKESAEQEHAIPINRQHCGLHLYGNVLPATKKANSDKGSKHYRDFDLVDAERLRKIEDFMSVAGYHQRAKPFQGLQAYCQSQYEVIKALCKTNKHYLENLLPEDMAERAHERIATPAGDQPFRNPQKGTVGALAKDCINDGLTDEEALQRVKAAFPTGSTSIKSIRWYRSKMRKQDGSIPTNRELKMRQRNPG